MSDANVVTRRRLLLGAGAAGLIAAAVRIAVDPSPNPRPTAPGQLCAQRRGIVFGSSAATWQLSDGDYRRLFAHEATMLFTEDDLLWYRLRPTPGSNLDFTRADRIVGFAERRGMLVFGAHLVWDEGFGDGWADDDLWGLDEQSARHLLFDTVRRVVGRYRGRVAAWSVVNEAISPEGVRGLRTDVPWYATIGPTYVAESFHIAHAADPRACLVLNEFGFETTNQYGDRPAGKQRATL